MKRFFILSLLLPLVFVGCKKGAKDAEPEQEVINLAVTPNSIISPSIGADYTLSLTAPEAWTASCADSWVKINPTSGNAGTVEISVKIAADKTSTEANSKIVFKSGDRTVEVPVKRLAKDPARLIIASDTEIKTPKDGGVYIVQVESNIKWQIASNVTWAKIDGEAVKRNNAIITVNVDPATMPEETVATITVTPMEGTGVEKQTVTITRSASDATSMTVDPQNMEAPAEGGSFTVNVTTDAKWMVTKPWDAYWVTLSDNNEKTGNGSFNITVLPSTSKTSIATVLTVTEVRSDSYRPVQLPVYVRRERKWDADLSVSPASIFAPKTGGDFTVEIYSSYEWKARVTGGDFFTISTTKGDGDATMVVSVAPAPEGGEEKNGLITIYSSVDGAKQELPIHRADNREPYFSVSPTKKVYFSPGNLWYHPRSKSWRFADRQYEYRGKINEDIKEDYDGWIDLFCWGTGYKPLMESYKDEDFAPFVDWGVNPIGNSGFANEWRTLTKDEWQYLYAERENANKLRGTATIKPSESLDPVNGYIFLPDTWVTPDGVEFSSGAKNYYMNQQWRLMEKEGAIFLPAAGFRDREVADHIVVHYMDTTGIYHSSTGIVSQAGDFVNYHCNVFMWGIRAEGRGWEAGIKEDHRYNGFSVRLVKDVK